MFWNSNNNSNKSPSATDVIAQEKLENLEKLTQRIERRKGVYLAPGYPAGFITDMPIPAWCKTIRKHPLTGEIEFIMQFVNPAYFEAYGIASEEYSGKQDVEIWGEEYAAEFRKNDLEALDKGVIYTSEMIYNKKYQTIQNLHVVKFCIANKGRVFAVAGMATSQFP